MSDIVATLKRINANSFTSEERKEAAMRHELFYPASNHNGILPHAWS